MAELELSGELVKVLEQRVHLKCLSASTGNCLADRLPQQGLKGLLLQPLQNRWSCGRAGRGPGWGGSDKCGGFFKVIFPAF